MSRRFVASVVIGALVLTGCIGRLGEKTRLADRIVAALEHLQDQKTAKGTISSSIRIVRSEGPDALPAGTAAPPTFTYGAALDFRDRRTQLVLQEAVQQSQEGVLAFMIYDDYALYLRRPRTEERSAGGRPWRKLDFGKLEPSEDSAAPGVVLFGAVIPVANPIVFFELMRGALAGSLETSGTEKIQGVKTTVYRANLDREKSVKDLRPKDRDEALEDLNVVFGSLGVEDETVFRSKIWLDEQGLVRKLEVRIMESPSSNVDFEQTVTIEMTDYGTPFTIALPEPRDLAEVESFGQIVGEFAIEMPAQVVSPAGS